MIGYLYSDYRVPVFGVALAACLVMCLSPRTTVGQQSDDERAEPRATPQLPSSDYHVVGEGETLYDVAAEQMGDGQKWPKLWSYNPQITNPHWIYPGDVIYLKPVNADFASAGDQKSDEDDSDGGDGDSSKVKAFDESAPRYFVSMAGFVAKQSPRYVGRILGSPKPVRMFAQRDPVWLGFGGNANPKELDYEIDRTVSFRQPKTIEPGTRFAIVREDGAVSDRAQKYGPDVRKYKVLGTVEVEAAKKGKFVEAKVTQSWQEISRGDLLVPYRQQLKRIQPVAAPKAIKKGAHIVDTFRFNSNIGEFHYVFINKGADTGVRPGHTFEIYQKLDGLGKLDSQRDKIPEQRVGRLLVIDTSPKFATAVVTDSVREITVGDRIEMHQGQRATN